MHSVIEKLIENQFLSFKHLGVISNFIEQTLDNYSSEWTNEIESYEIVPHHVGVLLKVYVDRLDEYIEHMDNLFPPALVTVKELAET